MKKDIMELLEERVLLFDGAMGTRLEEVGLTEQIAPEEWNLKNPEAIKGIHRSYLEVGSDIIETNTFGANRIKLAGHGLAEQFEELNRGAVELALAVSGDNYVAAAIGPLGKFLAPMGTITFREAVDIFKEQIKVLIAAGVELLNIETMSDPRELKAAVVAAREIDQEIPIIAQMTFDQNLRTLMGTTPEVAAVIISALEVDIIGANCSLGPAGLLEVAKKLKENTQLPVMVQPNAGLPELVAGETVYRESPEQMAAYIKDFLDAGVSIIGGCCGTNPQHIKAFAEKLQEFKRAKVSTPAEFRLASRIELFELPIAEQPILIGDRINTTQNRNLKEELLDNNFTLLKSELEAQLEAGIKIVNINLNNLDNEAELIKEVLEYLQRNPKLLLAVESNNLSALEVALESAQGKLLINSQVRAEQLDDLLALVKRYGAVLNTFINTGQELSKARRMELAREIKNRAQKYKLPLVDLLINPLLSGEKLDKELLEITIQIKEELDIEVALRPNSTTLSKAQILESALTFLIMN